MRKIIAYKITEDKKLFFGYVTLFSLIMSYFSDGGMLTVKPLKNYEQYSHYNKDLYISYRFIKLANCWWDTNDPFLVIAYNENTTVPELKKLPTVF